MNGGHECVDRVPFSRTNARPPFFLHNLGMNVCIDPRHAQASTTPIQGSTSTEIRTSPIFTYPLRIVPFYYLSLVIFFSFDRDPLFLFFSLVAMEGKRIQGRLQFLSPCVWTLIPSRLLQAAETSLRDISSSAACMWFRCFTSFLSSCWCCRATFSEGDTVEEQSPGERSEMEAGKNFHIMERTSNSAEIIEKETGNQYTRTISAIYLSYLSIYLSASIDCLSFFSSFSPMFSHVLSSHVLSHIQSHFIASLPLLPQILPQERRGEEGGRTRTHGDRERYAEVARSSRGSVLMCNSLHYEMQK